MLADSDISVAPPCRSLQHTNPTPGQPTPTDNATPMPTAVTQCHQAAKPQVNETDDGRHPPNETISNEDKMHNVNANEQNNDPKKRGDDPEQAKSDEDEEPNDKDQESNDEDQEPSGEDQHAEQDNQQHDAKANNERDTNPNPHQHATHAIATITTNTGINTTMHQHATPNPNFDTRIATHQCATHTIATSTTNTNTTMHQKAMVTNTSTNTTRHQHVMPTSAKPTVTGKGNADKKTTGALSLPGLTPLIHQDGGYPTTILMVEKAR